MPPPPSHYDGATFSQEHVHRPVPVQQQETVKPKDGNCKLFGIPLISPTTPEPSVSSRNIIGEAAARGHHVLDEPCLQETEQKLEQTRGSKPSDNPVVSNEQVCKQFPFGQQNLKDAKSKGSGFSTRSCTKVCDLPESFILSGSNIWLLQILIPYNYRFTSKGLHLVGLWTLQSSATMMN